LLAVALSLPESVLAPSAVPKGFLKKICANLLPAEIIDRKKQGFGAPMSYIGQVGDIEAKIAMLLAKREKSRRLPPFDAMSTNQVKKYVATANAHSHFVMLTYLVWGELFYHTCTLERPAFTLSEMM
jgi:hypothetical protein